MHIYVHVRIYVKYMYVYVYMYMHISMHITLQRDGVAECRRCIGRRGGGHGGRVVAECAREGATRPHSGDHLYSALVSFTPWRVVKIEDSNMG